jgi:hypothetical protein
MLMTSVRQRALDAIKVGDVIYGVSGNGNEKLILVYAASATSFFARHITSKTTAEFGRDGTTRPDASGGSCTIVSTAALPADAYQVALGLDRKLQTAKTDADHKLSKAEIELILSCGKFFRAHPLPE